MDYEQQSTGIPSNRIILGKVLSQQVLMHPLNSLAWLSIYMGSVGDWLVELATDGRESLHVYTLYKTLHSCSYSNATHIYIGRFGLRLLPLKPRWILVPGLSPFTDP